MTRDWIGSYAAMHARGEAEFPPPGLHYLLQLTRQSAAERGGKPLAPAEFTDYFLRRSRNDFGPLVRHVLMEWGISTPEHLGRAMVLLGNHGCLKLDPPDTAAAFASNARAFHD